MKRIRSRWPKWRTLMDDGLIQFLVVAVFIIVSMMDGAARKRRKQAQSRGTLPEPNRLSEVADDLDHTAESSEGIVPEDLWQEIAALARGEASLTRDPDSELEVWTAPLQEIPEMRTPPAEGGRPAGRSAESYDQPDTASLTETRAADLQSGYLHADQAASHEEHAHEKHAQVASPTRRLYEELPHEFVRHRAESPSKPQKELRSAQKSQGLLSGVRLGAGRSLRDAIIVAEVLSPPVSLRDSEWQPLF
jgi:hypothetical protein